MAKKEEFTTSDKVAKFFVEKKKILIICAVSLVVVLAAIFTIRAAVVSSNGKKLEKVVTLEESVYKLTEKNSDFDSAVADLKTLVDGSSYMSCKAQYLIGTAYALVEDYASAYDEYMKAYELNKEIYLAPLALVNAAVAAENNGNVNSAVECYNLAKDYETSGVGAKCLFNLGRISYTQGDVKLAKTYFETLTTDFEGSEYTAIAKNILTTL